MVCPCEVPMGFACIAFLALFIASVTALGQAPAPPPDWTRPGIEALGQNASSRTEFTLDHSMLVLASKTDQDDDDLRRVIAGVNGVSVPSYRFPRPGMDDPDLLVSVRRQDRTAGWTHMATTRDKHA